MNVEQLEIVCKNGLMRSVYMMTDSPLTFEKLLDLPPKRRLKVLEKVTGVNKISMADVAEANKKLAETKTLQQMQLFN